MSTELWLGIFYNFRTAAQVLMWGSFLGLVGFSFAYLCEKNHIDTYSLKDTKDLNSFSKIIKISIIVLIPSLLISLIPTTDDLFKYRLDLIKLELADSKNVKQTQETIQRIADKLECKYLGCEKKESK